MRRARRAALTSAIVLSTVLGAGVATTPAAAAAPAGAATAASATRAGAAAGSVAVGRTTTGLRHTVVSGDRRYRLDLHPVGIRSPRFGVFVQRPDGSLRRVQVGATRAYVGSVRGSPAATAVAVRGRDGVLRGQLVDDGRATAYFTGREVTGTDGTDRPAYHWPSADEASRNVTVAPGQVEDRTRRWDIGYDLDFSYVGSDLDGSVARAMDGLELTTVQMLGTYETNARLRPAIGRVVLRTSQAASPYAGREAELGDVREEWRGALGGDVVDAVAYLHSDGGGGGLAYVGTVGGDYAVSLNGSGNSYAIIRHELGHSWGPGDNHTNGPEGQTIESGNDYARFDGTELAAILTTRSERLAESPGRFPRVATSRVELPPYATLDLRDRLRAGTTVRLRPTRNDVDANGDRVRLRSVPARSHLGVRLVRKGDTVVYRAPRVRQARTLDYFRYTVTDGRGRTASGVTMVRVSPRG